MATKSQLSSIEKEVKKAEEHLKQVRRKREEFLNSIYLKIGKLVTQEASILGDDSSPEEHLKIWEEKVKEAKKIKKEMKEIEVQE